MDKLDFAKYVELERLLQPTIKIDNEDVKVILLKNNEQTFTAIRNECPKINVTTQKLKFIVEWFSKTFCDRQKIDFHKFVDSDMFENLPFRRAELIVKDDVDDDLDILFYRGEIAKEVFNVEVPDMHCIEFIQILENKYGRLGAYDLDNGHFKTNSPDDVNFMGYMQLILITLVFIRDYQEIIHHREVSETSTRIQNKNGKIKRHKTTLIRKVYDIDDDVVTYVKKHHRYTKPTKEFGVRGFYRHYKSGKVSWVNGFSKYKDAETKQSQEYVV